MMKTNKFITFLFLKPLSKTWEFVYRTRRAFYEYGFLKKEYFKVPIISVGNLSFGGTGKTPMIIWLANYFEDHGFVPLVLTRGYKGALEHKSGFLKAGDRFRTDPELYGDEPLLISSKMKKGTIVIGKKRSENLKKYFKKFNPDIVLLDDGFQHIKLYRSLNIVLFDALMSFDKYKTAPLGYLREGLSSLKNADVIVITRSDQVDSEKLFQLENMLRPHLRQDIPVCKTKYRASGIFDCYDRKTLENESLKDVPVIALSAIASPESFYLLLESYGAKILEKISFDDHHFFTVEEIESILERATLNKALVVMSEKDMVKVKKIYQDPKLQYLSIDVEFVSQEEEFLNSIRKLLPVD